MNRPEIVDYSPEYRSSIRRILTAIGWAEQYIRAAEENADTFSQNPDVFGSYIALLDGTMIGFLYVQYYAWNQLAQIQGLAVDLNYRRQGIARLLVERAEVFARERKARGIYVDTPTSNAGGRRFYEAAGYSFGYAMPRYYEDHLDGITYQKFFDT